MGVKKNTLPTMRQIGYLTELEKYDGKSVQISKVARKCNTDHSAVGRFFKNCCDNGILTPEYHLTETGEKWLHDYQRLIDSLKIYYKDAMLSDGEMEAVCTAMIENVEPHVLKRIFSGKNRTDAARTCNNVRVTLTEAVQERKKIRVSYCFYRMEGNYTRSKLSMANGGFVKEAAYLRWMNGKVYLDLTICEMSAHSRIDGREMKGYLRTFKYNESGFMREVVPKDGHVYVPLTACRLWRGQTAVTRGTILVTVTCSVGDEHMPESTAALVFWA